MLLLGNLIYRCEKSVDKNSFTITETQKVFEVLWNRKKDTVIFCLRKIFVSTHNVNLTKNILIIKTSRQDPIGCRQIIFITN